MSNEKQQLNLGCLGCILVMVAEWLWEALGGEMAVCRMVADSLSFTYRIPEGPSDARKCSMLLGKTFQYKKTVIPVIHRFAATLVANLKSPEAPSRPARVRGL